MSRGHSESSTTVGHTTSGPRIFHKPGSLMNTWNISNRSLVM